jgi:ABC-type dipeptide/oligopeptide/nickel transport system permease subunit
MIILLELPNFFLDFREEYKGLKEIFFGMQQDVMSSVIDSNQENLTQVRERTVFKPALYTWLFTLIGLSLYGVSVLFGIFGLGIVLISELRTLYMNWAVASFISLLLIVLTGRFIINNFGAKYFLGDSLSFSFKSPFGKSHLITKDDILHIEVNFPNPILEKITLSSPQFVIITYNKTYKFRSKHWRKSNDAIKFFQDESEDRYDAYALFYHKSKRSLPKYILRMSQDTPGMIGLTILTIYTFFALWGAFAMLISPPDKFFTHTLFLRNPEFQNYFLPGYTFEETVKVAPNSDFWFGTDWIGRDIFSRVVFGTTYTFMIAIAGSLVSIVFILFFGLSSAFFGGWWDNIVTRISDTLLTFPPFILLLLISTLTPTTIIRGEIPGGYYLVIYTVMAFVTWPLGARLIRTEVLETLNTEYVLAAKQIGSSRYQILISHIFPKIFPTLLILFSYQFTDIIIGTSLLGFLGFGSESTLTWGSDIAHAEYQNAQFTLWWTIFFPTMALFLLVFGMTLFTDSIRDSMDPQLRGGIKAVPYEYRYELGL